MRSVRPLCVVPGVILALLAGACGDGADQPDPPATTRAELAGEVEHIVGLLEDGHGCAVLEAVRLLEVMTDRADDDQVRAAIDQFTTGVRSSVDCDPDEDEDEDEDDQDEDDAVDTGDGGGDPPPGRGRGRGRGN
jgi:hypothetical protein